MAKLDRATIKRRAIVLVVFIAFALTLGIISSRRLGHMNWREEQLAQAGPAELVELFLTARTEGDLTLKVLCLTNELKLALSDLPLPEKHAAYYARLVAEEEAAPDRYLHSLDLQGLQQLPATRWPAGLNRELFADLYPQVDPADVALVAAEYEANFRGPAASASGEYREVYVLVRQPTGAWRIADWVQDA